TRTSVYVPIAMSNVVSCRVAHNRNDLVKNCRQNGATDILWVDADIRFPANGILRLMSYDKDIVCATTARRQDNDTRGIGIPLKDAEVRSEGKLWKMQ